MISSWLAEVDIQTGRAVPPTKRRRERDTGDGGGDVTNGENVAGQRWPPESSSVPKEGRGGNPMIPDAGIDTGKQVGSGMDKRLTMAHDRPKTMQGVLTRDKTPTRRSDQVQQW